MRKNPIVHFEISADDPEALSKFYTSLFDWTIEAMPEMDYHVVSTVETDDRGMPTQAGGINGGISKRSAADTYSWLNYVNVDSLDRALDRAQTLGAKVKTGKSPVPGMGWFAVLTDPQGNVFGMWQTDPNAK